MSNPDYKLVVETENYRLYTDNVHDYISLLKFFEEQLKDG